MCASPQCHELSLQPKQAVVLKFLHELCILVAAGIDSRALLIRNLARHRAHSGADRPRSSNLIPASPLPASPLPLVSQRPMQTARQQPASLATGRDQQVCTPSLPARCTDSRMHLPRASAVHPCTAHPAHGGAHRLRSVTLEPVSRCHPSCTGR